MASSLSDKKPTVACSVCLEAFAATHTTTTTTVAMPMSPCREDMDTSAVRLLRCGHSFCSGCLVSMLEPSMDELGPTVVCPLCRGKTSHVHSVQSDLKRNFALMELIEEVDRSYANPPPSSSSSSPVPSATATATTTSSQQSTSMPLTEAFMDKLFQEGGKGGPRGNAMQFTAFLIVPCAILDVVSSPLRWLSSS